jgi:hypothetical protein
MAGKTQNDAIGADGGINGLDRLIPAQVQGVRKKV